jgi:hypothetical protein
VEVALIDRNMYYYLNISLALKKKKKLTLFKIMMQLVNERINMLLDCLDLVKVHSSLLWTRDDDSASIKKIQ